MMTLSPMDLIPVVMLFLLYFMGMPIVYSLFGATFFFFLVLDASSPAWLIMQKVMKSTQSFSMLAIPFFVMSGSVMNYGGISDKMMDFAEVLTGHMKGGLAQVNVLLSMLMLFQGFLRRHHRRLLGGHPRHPPWSQPDRLLPDRSGLPGPGVRRRLCARHPDVRRHDGHRGGHRQQARL